MTLVTALSEVGGLNPVSQAALTYLKPGDVVQLESVQVPPPGSNVSDPVDPPELPPLE